MPTTGWYLTMKTKKEILLMRKLGIITLVGVLFYIAAVITKNLTVGTVGLACVTTVSFMYFLDDIW